MEIPVELKLVIDEFGMQGHYGDASKYYPLYHIVNGNPNIPDCGIFSGITQIYPDEVGRMRDMLQEKVQKYYGASATVEIHDAPMSGEQMILPEKSKIFRVTVDNENVLIELYRSNKQLVTNIYRMEG